MDTELFANTQRTLGELLGYLEELHPALDLPVEIPGGLSHSFHSIFHHAGYVQGLYLKTQGFLSADLEEFIEGLAYTFELEVLFKGNFRLPFLGCEISLQRKTLNTFREAAWEIYHAALLSAYALHVLTFHRTSSPDAGELDILLRITSADAI